MMARSEIPVDLFNPGQVLACVGLMEAANELLGGASAGFDWRPDGSTWFCLAAAGARAPLPVVLHFLRTARATAIAPAGSEHTTTKWSVPTEPSSAGAGFPYPAPKSPATLPARLDGEVADGLEVRRATLTIDYWADDRSASGRDTFKLWGGAGGYPGAGLTRDALELLADVDVETPVPFEFARPQSSAFRLDWRRDYIPIDAGFSPNEHQALCMVGYPLVELLAAIGLTHARPERIDRLEFRYGVVRGPHVDVHPSFVRAAIGAAELPFPRRTFRLQLGSPGKEGQDRCITTVTEEPTR